MATFVRDEGFFAPVRHRADFRDGARVGALFSRAAAVAADDGKPVGAAPAGATVAAGAGALTASTASSSTVAYSAEDAALLARAVVGSLVTHAAKEAAAQRRLETATWIPLADASEDSVARRIMWMLQEGQRACAKGRSDEELVAVLSSIAAGGAPDDEDAMAEADAVRPGTPGSEASDITDPGDVGAAPARARGAAAGAADDASLFTDVDTVRDSVKASGARPGEVTVDESEDEGPAEEDEDDSVLTFDD